MNSFKLIKNSLLLTNLKPSKLILNSNSSIFNGIIIRSQSSSSSSLQINKNSDKKDNNTDLIFSSNAKKNEKAESISRAMIYYLERMAERDSILKFKTEEFEIGKRHVAKMMGQNPETMTQADIDKAIEYLLPSSLYQTKARPFLKHPEAYYPKSKLAAFGRDGRPLHTLFYTNNPEFYQLIYDITQKIINLNKMEDAVFQVKNRLDYNDKSRMDSAVTKIDMTGCLWITHENLCKKLNSKIDEFSYNKFIALLQKLADHPLSKREEEFLNQFKVSYASPINMGNIEELKVDENGRKYQSVEAVLRTAIVKLKMYEGTGKIDISSLEGKFDISYFEALTHRETIMYPFKVIDRINKFDLDITVNKGGMGCLAKGIRYAISKGLCSFLPTDLIEKLRLSGALTKEPRRRERKKPGQLGPRRRYTWKKR